jgi:transcriptional regulator with XRE-family HTH domain
MYKFYTKLIIEYLKSNFEYKILIMDTFGQRLTLRRKAKGLTQQQLGDILGKSKSAIASYESDRIQPSNDDLVMMADVLQCTTDFLLRGASENNSEVSKTETSVSSALDWAKKVIEKQDMEIRFLKSIIVQAGLGKSKVSLKRSALRIKFIPLQKKFAINTP